VAGRDSPRPLVSGRLNASTGRVLGLATVGMGLLAGLFYAYACSVMPGLGQADDRTVVDAMQQIDEAIQNRCSS
jgi:uncharacterized membrane protein